MNRNAMEKLAVNRKKILVFLLFAYLPMVAVGLFLHFKGGLADLGSAEPAAALTGILFSAGSMLIPLLAVVFTQLIFNEPVFRDLGISFRINRWWWIGWMLIPLLSLAVLGLTLLMPGVRLCTDGEMLEAAKSNLPPGIGTGGIIALTLFSGLFMGVTLNAVLSFGEEIAWRGFLPKELKGLGFLKAALIIGVIWGLWHAPLILNGHNYPQHPVAGVFMMTGMCLCLTPLLLFFRQKSGSVIVPAIMHGTFNAVIGLSFLLVSPWNEFLCGGTGLAGFIVLLLADAACLLYDRPGRRRITRIREMEEHFDAVLRVMNEAAPMTESIRGELDILREYMDSGQWKKDFEADEAGLLPPGLKRGVLSEDGLYNLFEEHKTS